MSVEVACREKAVVTRALAVISDIATLPEVTVKIIGIVEDPNSTARDLHQVIKTDPALSAKVLKVVNSAFYGLPGQVASVDRAIVLLGMSAVKNIAVAASIARLFKSGKMSEQFSARDLWRHSVAVGVAARLIAKASGQPAGLDEVFLAGLIHDIGILVQRQAFADQLSDVIARCSAGEGDFGNLEVAIIGADHQAFGDGLTTKWKFPRHLRAAVGFHHYPEKLSAELRKLGSTVCLADVICCQRKLGFHLTAQHGQVTEELVQATGVTPEQLDEIDENLEEALEEAENMLVG
ncbi:MAG TPA: HDOD domain-containing protein [Phycisphaerae bacterium]|nr:HDOD domain-containing protein [Phycisphaerae bacterium]